MLNTNRHCMGHIKIVVTDELGNHISDIIDFRHFD